MKNKALFISLMVGSIYVTGLFTFCTTKKTDCPAYDNPAFDKWFPYHVGQIIVFTNGASGTNSLEIGYIDKSGSYTERGGGGCSSRGEIHSNEEDSNGRWLLSIVDIGYDMSLSLNGLILPGYVLSEDSCILFFNHPEFERSYFTNYVLQGRTYPFVEVITKTWGNTDGKPYKVYISPQSGIVGYELFPTNELWTLQ